MSANVLDKTRLTVIYKSPDCLTPDPRNARTHSRKQVEEIANSIRAFGFANPILTDPEVVSEELGLECGDVVF